VTLLRRHPRELYRVYAEEEFFAGARTGEGLSGELTPPQLEDRRRRRLAGAVLLAGAVGTVGGVVVINREPRARDGARRPGLGSQAASTRPRRAARTLGEEITRPLSHSLAPARRRRPGPTDPAARRMLADSVTADAVDGRTTVVRAPTGVRSSAVSSAGPPRSPGAEFGFER
jgi:hypothetical protein